MLPPSAADPWKDFLCHSQASLLELHHPVHHAQQARDDFVYFEIR